MKQSSLRFMFFTLIAAAALCTGTVQSVALLRPAHDKTLVPSRAASFVQFDDPYSDFRNARYSNARLLSEADEIKLGMQLHREAEQHHPDGDRGEDSADPDGPLRAGRGEFCHWYS